METREQQALNRARHLAEALQTRSQELETALDEVAQCQRDRASKLRYEARQRRLFGVQLPLVVFERYAEAARLTNRSQSQFARDALEREYLRRDIII